jgi:hypothetical protein
MVLPVVAVAVMSTSTYLHGASVTSCLSCSSLLVGVVDAAARSPSLLWLFLGSVAIVRIDILFTSRPTAEVIWMIACWIHDTTVMHDPGSIDHPDLLVPLS